MRWLFCTHTHNKGDDTCWLIQENDEIRCASIYLMGNLSKFGSGEQVFTDQIHNVLVSLLLHLVDPNPQVVKVEEEACTCSNTLTHALTHTIITEKDAILLTFF